MLFPTAQQVNLDGLFATLTKIVATSTFNRRQTVNVGKKAFLKLKSCKQNTTREKQQLIVIVSGLI